jgi:Spy/CpxP family protein refolding chaperone
MSRIVRGLGLAILLALVSRDALAQRQPGGPPTARRQQLERELRERTGDVVRRRLGLNDSQMARLQATNRQFEQQRMSLFAQERETRQALRQELAANEQANESRVSQLIDQTLTLERQRLDLLQDEQKELAKFLTPVQRAKLLGLQAELRRRAQDMRRR